MTREDVVRIGREVGLPHWYDTKGLVNEKQLIKFANRVAEHEREAILGLADSLGWVNVDHIKERAQA